MVARPKVVVGQADPSQTDRAGVVLLGEVERVLGVVRAVDDVVLPIGRRVGWSAGELLFAAADMMLGGGDFMVDFDHQRADAAGQRLRAVRLPSAMTFGSLAYRFDDARVTAVEGAVGKVLVGRWWAALPPARRQRISGAGFPTIDLDTTDVEVYGTKKEGVSYNYQGQRVGRVHLASWADAGVVVAGELGSGDTDPRPQAPALIARAAAALPGGLGRPRVRCDAGYHDHKIGQAALAAGCDFAVALKRNQALWRAETAIPADAWTPAKDMTGAEVAWCPYFPAGWPEGTRCLVRRVAIAGEFPSRRSRRRRTIPPLQRLLGLLDLGPAYAYSFILTNVAGDAAPIEAWFRHRAQIEERIKDTKLGMPLRHLPSGRYHVNRVWMWAAFLALNLSTFTQTLAQTDNHPTKADRNQKAHGKRARRELICITARLITHSRQTILRPTTNYHTRPFRKALNNLQQLPTHHHPPG